MDLQFLSAVVAIVGLIGALWKVFNVIATIKHEIQELNYKLELQEYLTNGVKDRMEHINSRVSGEIKEHDRAMNAIRDFLNEKVEHWDTKTGTYIEKLQRSINAIEGWLQKNTTFEKRE